MIKVLCLRRIGLEDRTANEGETVEIDIETAKKLQKSKAVEIILD